MKIYSVTYQMKGNYIIELYRCEMLRQVGLNRIVIGQIIQLFSFLGQHGLISA